MFEAIEKKFGFNYPDLFHRLLMDGMLDWVKRGPSWYRDCYPALRKIPPFLLFTGEFELMELDEVEKAIGRLSSKSREFSHVIPFGKTGAGEMYCLVYRAEESPDFICKFNQFADESIKLAKTVEDFMFRMLLGAVVQINPDEFQNDEKSFMDDLRAMLASHRAYLPEHRFALLKSLYAKQFSEQDDTLGALSLDEFFEILEREMNFEGVGEKFDDLAYAK